MHFPLPLHDGNEQRIRQDLLQKLLPKFFEVLRCNIANQICIETLKLRINSSTPSFFLFSLFSVAHKKKPQSTFCYPFLNKSVLAVSKSSPGQTVWYRHQFMLSTHHMEYYKDNSFHVTISLSTITDTEVNTAVFRPRKNNYKPTNETMFNF